jgi:hypothetical protein
MAGRFRLGRRGGRVAVVLATTAYVTGLALAAAPPGHTIGGSCNGHLASRPNLDASHERGPVILEGTTGDDVIIGSRGDDIIHGNGGDDYICGGAGADDITAGETVTTCSKPPPSPPPGRGGGGGKYVALHRPINVDSDCTDRVGKATVFGEWGDDTIRVGDGDNFVSGGPGNDEISVGKGRNYVYGGPGNDIINASDTGDGSKINGGPGYNLCFVNPNAEVDNCRFR